MADPQAQEEKLPLELRTALVEDLPALHPAWVTDVHFLPFMPPSYDSSGQVEPLWVETIEMIDRDLHWLLQLPHQKFWCQVMYDTTLQKCLDSYLHSVPRLGDDASFPGFHSAFPVLQATESWKKSLGSLATVSQVTPPSRSYDEAPQLPLGVQDSLRNVHRRVFMTFLRMATHKETSDHFFSPEAFADIIYNHFLFDIPKLLDLCVLYNTANRALLSKMVANVFEKQPKYHDDFESSVESILKLLERVCLECQEGEGNVQRLDQIKSLPPSQLVDVVLYIGDIGATLRAFVDVYPPAVSQLAKANFMERIVSFYETTIPSLQTQWHTHKHVLKNASHVKSRLRQAKHDLAWLVNSLLHSLSSDEGPRGETDFSDRLDGILSAVTTILSDKSFLREFEKHFSLGDCVREVQRNHPDVTLLSELQVAISTAVYAAIFPNMNTSDETHFKYILSALGVHEATPTSASPLAASGTEDTLQSKVTYVKEILPHLGDGFIEACLKEYGNVPETAINHILLGSLPPLLQKMDQSAPRKQPSQEESVEPKLLLKETLLEEPSLLDQRSNIYDNDEFDVFRRKDVDLTKVHIGKTFDGTSTSSLLNDKSHLTTTRYAYTAYQYMSPEGEGDQYDLFDQFDQYNDEYDDTYDSHNVGAADNVSAEELFTVRRLNVKGLYRRHISSSEDEEQETRPEESAFNLPSSSRPITILRRGGEGQMRGATREPPTAKVGSSYQPPVARGRGEDRARQMKEKHKGSRANHNRRNLADRKRNRGMGAPPRN